MISLGCGSLIIGSDKGMLLLFIQIDYHLGSLFFDDGDETTTWLLFDIKARLISINNILSFTEKL